ncbi:MAG: hypothetical protein PHT07_10150 [Paludibacter sp.]|nr:hypothetical protein [Paludibacter sp.]
MLSVTMTVKFIAESGAMNATETFLFKSLDREDIDDSFFEDIISTSLRQGDMGRYAVDYDELVTITDKSSCYINNIDLTHDMAAGNIIDWKVLKSKTKIKTVV